MAWKPAVALSFLVAGAAVNAEEATAGLVDSNAANGRNLQAYTKWSYKPKGGHSLQKHFRKKFTFRRPRGRWVKKYGDDHSDHSGKYSGYEGKYSDDESNHTKSTYSGSSYGGSTTSKNSGYKGGHDSVDTYEKKSYSHGYTPKHRLTKSLLKKFFDKPAYNPVTKYGHGYDDDKKSYGGKTGQTYSSYSGSSYSSEHSSYSGSSYSSENSYDSGSGSKYSKGSGSGSKYSYGSGSGSKYSKGSGSGSKYSYGSGSGSKYSNGSGSHHSSKSHKAVDINVGPRYGSPKDLPQTKVHKEVDIDVVLPHGSHHGSHHGSQHGSQYSSKPYGHGWKSSGSKSTGHASVSVRYGSGHPKTFFFKGAHKVSVKAKSSAHGDWKPSKPAYGSGSHKDTGSSYGHDDHVTKTVAVDTGYGAKKEAL